MINFQINELVLCSYKYSNIKPDDFSTISNNPLKIVQHQVFHLQTTTAVVEKVMKRWKFWQKQQCENEQLRSAMVVDLIITSGSTKDVKLLKYDRNYYLILLGHFFIELWYVTGNEFRYASEYRWKISCINGNDHSSGWRVA